MNFSVQGLGGGLFDHKKRVTFVVGDRFSSMEIVSEPATPALKRRLFRKKIQFNVGLF